MAFLEALLMVLFLLLPETAHSGVLVDSIFSFFVSSPEIDVQGLTQMPDGNFYGCSAFLNGVFRLTPSGFFSIFATLPTSEEFPTGALARGSDGALYGVTQAGGPFDAGTIFKVTTSGLSTTLYSFNTVTNDDGVNLDGLWPRAGLVLGHDGNFYGTTSGGGINGMGTIFRISVGGDLTTLYSFGMSFDTNGNAVDGDWPIATLTEGSDGDFYGATEYGGVGNGTLFKVSSNGRFTQLYQIPGPPTNLAVRTGPPSALVESANGYFYGTTTYGGSNFCGSIFRLGSKGGFTTIYSFRSDLDGAFPLGRLVAGRDGNLYGTASGGGPGSNGTIFRVSPAGKFDRLAAFDGNHGSAPQTLIQSKDGSFFGTTAHSGIFRLMLPGALKLVYDGAGALPFGKVIQGRDGNLYGCTLQDRGGTVFCVNPFGGYRRLCSLNETNGANLYIYPTGGLVEGDDGYFYGTAGNGGTNNIGTVYKVAPGGNIQVLVKFNSANGAAPQGTLVKSGQNEFCGITFSGGKYSAGTIFRISGAGHFTTLYDFDGKLSGGPSSLIISQDGTLYGTTFAGGSGNGTIFRFGRPGAFTTLASLDGENGSMPEGLALGPNDQLFGIARGGGTNGDGTFFRVGDLGGGFQVLGMFGGQNGVQPNPPLLARDGYFYGTTFGDATGAGGGFYRVSPAGELTTSLSVTGSGGLIQGADGAFYGTSVEGGYFGEGEVIRIAPSKYRGLFWDTNFVGFQSSGEFEITVNLALGVSGTLTMGGRQYSFCGRMDTNLLATVNVARSGVTDLRLSLQFSETKDAVLGTVTDGDWTAPLFGLKPGLYNAANEAPEMGRYRLRFTNLATDGFFREGSGMVTISPAGTIHLAGVLPDSSSFAQSTVMSGGGNWPVFASLYGGKGMISGWIAFSNSMTSQLGGTLNWIKTGPMGFTNVLTVAGCNNTGEGTE